MHSPPHARGCVAGRKTWASLRLGFYPHIINLSVLSPLISCDQCKRNDEEWSCGPAHWIWVYTKNQQIQMKYQCNLICIWFASQIFRQCSIVHVYWNDEGVYRCNWSSKSGSTWAWQSLLQIFISFSKSCKTWAIVLCWMQYQNKDRLFGMSLISFAWLPQ